MFICIFIVLKFCYPKTLLCGFSNSWWNGSIFIVDIHYNIATLYEKWSMQWFCEEVVHHLICAAIFYPHFILLKKNYLISKYVKYVYCLMLFLWFSSRIRLLLSWNSVLLCTLKPCVIIKILVNKFFSNKLLTATSSASVEILVFHFCHVDIV
jgi:hypothetical protein